ncbi:MAG: hypothetical protein WBA97_13375 [Actinophytocola sp.]|uniref:hypothetical protein n=1 Tax=Actinophytocola sp. TaxID=1872138 RepID=UPI003C78E709
MPRWHDSGVTRTEICATTRRGGTLRGMETSWTVRGAYANWTMTVRTDPPDPDDEIEYRDAWPAEPFTRLNAHFREVVNLLEAVRGLDNVPAALLSYT